MYHLLVDSSDESGTRTVKRKFEDFIDSFYWYNRIQDFKPDSIILWEDDKLLGYVVNIKEQI